MDFLGGLLGVIWFLRNCSMLSSDALFSFIIFFSRSKSGDRFALLMNSRKKESNNRLDFAEHSIPHRILTF